MPASSRSVLSYAHAAPNGSLQMERTDDGITITRLPHVCWVWSPPTLLILLLLAFLAIPALCEVIRVWQYRDWLGNSVLRNLGAESVVLMLLVAAASVIVVPRWRRRRTPASIEVRDGKLILITPERLRLRREISLGDVLHIRITSTGWNACIQLHLARDKRITVFRGCTATELEWACRMLREEIAEPTAILLPQAA